MSPSALLEDRAPSCMLYSMVECRAWGSRTHPWPCRAMPGNSVQRRCAPRREGKVKGLGGHSPTEGGVVTKLLVVENSQLFAQRAHSARYAPINYNAGASFMDISIGEGSCGGT